VLDEHTGAEVAPGSDDVGFVAVSGYLPLGYYKDTAKTEATFRVVDGVRYSIPGDYGTVEPDGSIRLLGRGSACINTGGEKVYPEEVELAVRAHPDVFDCVIVGVPDERFGEMVVALVQVMPDRALDDAALTAWSRDRLAGYKRPKRWFVVDSLQRSAAGKADHRRLRALATELVDTTRDA
jgi:3-oxocholest-4-en-26-oate---CoA ligase